MLQCMADEQHAVILHMHSRHYLQSTAAPLVGRDVAKSARSLVQVHACMLMEVCSVTLPGTLTSSMRQNAEEINALTRRTSG